MVGKSVTAKIMIKQSKQSFPVHHPATDWPVLLCKLVKQAWAQVVRLHTIWTTINPNSHHAHASCCITSSTNSCAFALIGAETAITHSLQR